MNKKYDNVIALCIKEGGGGEACIFDDCPLFLKCFPLGVEKLMEEDVE
jgi:hypothetical protein